MVIGNLPDGWKSKDLGDLVSFVGSGVTPKGGKNVYLKEGVPFIRSQNVYPDGLRLEDVAYVSKELHAEMSRTHVRAGDVLLNITGASIGRSTFVPESFGEANVNQHVCILRPLNIVSPKFLSAFLNSNNGQDQIMGAQSGVTRQGLNYTQVRVLQIPVPPVPEQERIVSRIEELLSDLDAGVTSLKRVRAGLKRFKASVLKAACEGKLLENREETENGELPEGWKWAKVEELAKVGTGATPLRSEAKYWNGGKIPWVTSGALNELAVHEAKEFITELAVKETNAKVFSAGALLVAMYGEGKTRGKVSELMIDAATNQACAALIFSGEMLEHKPYVKLFFEKNYEDIRLLSSGGVQPNLNLSIIKNTRISLPPLDEQRRIVAEVERRLSVVGEVESAVEVGLVRAGRLRQSVLRSAFEGRL